MLDAVTLDQLRMLVAIADEGSFTAAAKRLRRAQSAVSHGIRTLEAQLDLRLFDRSTKKPTFTEAGSTILAEARTLLVRADRLRATARGLASGLEGEMAVACGVIVPETAWLDVLATVRDAFPRLSLRIFREEVGGVPDLLMRGIAELGFAGAQSLAPYGEDVFDRRAIGSAGVVAVAAPDHPLARLGRAATDADLADHRQLVPTSRVLPRYDHTLVHDTWEVADLGLRHRMIVRGLGWGTVPTALASADLAAGRLLRVRIEARSDDALRVPLFAIWRTGDAVGPARRWLIEALRDRLDADATGA
ncbi:MAG: LysR substrate-binding domain-containing protein [Acidobacteriota bacterium]